MFKDREISPDLACLSFSLLEPAWSPPKLDTSRGHKGLISYARDTAAAAGAPSCSTVTSTARTAGARRRPRCQRAYSAVAATKGASFTTRRHPGQLQVSCCAAPDPPIISRVAGCRWLRLGEVMVPLPAIIMMVMPGDRRVAGDSTGVGPATRPATAPPGAQAGRCTGIDQRPGSSTPRRQAPPLP